MKLDLKYTTTAIDLICYRSCEFYDAYSKLKKKLIPYQGDRNKELPLSKEKKKKEKYMRFVKIKYCPKFQSLHDLLLLFLLLLILLLLNYINKFN